MHPRAGQVARGAARRTRSRLAEARISWLVATNIREIRRGADAARSRADRSAPPRVYVFWAQSIDNAPAVIRLCAQQMLRVHAPGDVVVLDMAAARELVEPDVLRRTETDLPMLADVLRLELLTRRGGVWSDASCLAMTDVIARTRDLLGSGFFAFTRYDRPLASWFLASEPGGYVVAMWREAMLTYWRHFDRKLDYFVVHLLFDALCRHDPEFRRRWYAVPRIGADAAESFQFAMAEPYDEARSRELLARSFVHKLTYKVGEPVVQGPTLLGHLLREGPPAR